MYVTVRGDKRPATFRRTRSEWQSARARQCTTVRCCRQAQYWISAQLHGGQTANYPPRRSVHVADN